MRIYYRDMSNGRATYNAIVNASAGEQSFVIATESVVMYDANLTRLRGVANSCGGKVKAPGRRSQRAVFTGLARESILASVMPAGNVS